MINTDFAQSAASWTNYPEPQNAVYAIKLSNIFPTHKVRPTQSRRGQKFNCWWLQLYLTARSSKLLLKRDTFRCGSPPRELLPLNQWPIKQLLPGITHLVRNKICNTVIHRSTLACCCSITISGPEMCSRSGRTFSNLFFLRPALTDNVCGYILKLQITWDYVHCKDRMYMHTSGSPSPIHW